MGCALLTTPMAVTAVLLAHQIEARSSNLCVARLLALRYLQLPAAAADVLKHLTASLRVAR